MKELNQKDVVLVLESLIEDWAIVDESDDDDFVIFVNESRDEMENVRPKKEFIKELENLGFIIDSNQKFGLVKREIGTFYQKDSPESEWIAVSKPDPIVYFFEVTQKGKDFLLNEKLEY